MGRVYFHDSIYRRIAVIFVLAAFLLIQICSCSNNIAEFPEINRTEHMSSEAQNQDIIDNTGGGFDTSADTADEPASDTANSYHELTVALPYSQETINRLVKLFWGYRNGIFGDDTNMLAIDIDEIDNIDTPYVINAVLTADTGLSADAVSRLVSSDELPDVFLTCDLPSVAAEGIAAPLDEYGSDIVFDNEGIAVDAILDCKYEGSIYGYPLYQSIMILFGNADFFPQSGRMHFLASMTEFRSFLTDVRDDFSEDGIVPFVSAARLIPYLEMSFDNDSDADAITESVEFIDALYDDSISFETAEDGTDPCISRQAAMWMDSSASFEQWNSYYAGNLYYSLLPSSRENGEIFPYAGVYSLCVSEECIDKDFAAEFASFICFNRNAQMLLHLLEPHEGFLPVLASQQLWDVIKAQPGFGGYAAVLEQYMENAIYVPVPGSRAYAQMQENCLLYEAGREDADESSADISILSWNNDN